MPTLRDLLYDCLTQLVLVHFADSWTNLKFFLTVCTETAHSILQSSELCWNYFLTSLYLQHSPSCFPVSLTLLRQWESADFCQLYVKPVTELSTQCCSHLSSWQRMVISEQQSHFSITPLSPISLPLLLPLLLSFHFTFFFCSLISSFVFSPLFTSSQLS